MTLRQSLLACFLFANLAMVARAFSIGQSKFRVTKSPNDYYIVAPELLRHESFAFAKIEKIGKSPYKINVDVSIVNYTDTKKCSINLMPAAKATNVGITSIRRLAWGRVLIVAYDDFANGERRFVPILLNFQECLFIFPYSKILPVDHSIFTTNSVVDDRNRFMIVTSNRKFCSTHNSCAVVVMINLSFSELEGFDVDLAPEDVRIEPLSASYDRHFYVIRGFDASGTYRFSLYDTQEKPTKRMALMSLANAASMQIVTSKLSICWIEKPGIDAVVYCSKFSNNGSLLFNRTVVYEEPVTISFVENTFLGLLLFASKSQCEGIDCWIIFISTMSEDDQFEQQGYHTSRLECMGDRKQLVVFKAHKDVGSIQAEYVCDNGYEFTFNVIGVTDQQV